MKIASFGKLFDHSIVARMRPGMRSGLPGDSDETQTGSDGSAALRRFAADLMKGSEVLVGTVVGFPHGNETPSMKAYQVSEVLDLGAREIDMVMNIPP